MTSTKQPRLSVRSSADLIAAVPYLLGFHPIESVVVVGMRGPKIVFAARGDLPARGDSAAADSTARYIASVVVRQGVESASVIGYGGPESVDDIVGQVGAALGRAGVAILEELRVAEGRYWSYQCENPQCCPPEGTPYDVATSQLAAAATFAGQVALPDRSALTQQVAPIGGLTRESMRQATARADDRLGELLAAAPPSDVPGGRALRAAGETAVREAMARYRQRGRLTDDEAAWLSVLLLHLPVRDFAWEHIGDEDWHCALWMDVLRRAEPDLVAPPASLLAFAAWRSGQGALASVALDRALRDDPEYSMALLLQDALRQGLPPSSLDGWPHLDSVRSGRRGRKPRRRKRGARA